MPFCPKCGTEYAEGAKFCGKCGTVLDAAPADQSARQNAAQPVFQPVTKTTNFFTKLMDTKDITDRCTPADIQSNKGVAVLGYCASFIYILLSWFISNLLCVAVAAALMAAPVIMAKNSVFLRHHATQAVTLLLTSILMQIVDGTLSSLVFQALYNPWGNQYILGTVFAWLVHIVVMGVPALIGAAGVMNAIKGKAKDLPIIGRFKITIDK